MAVFLPKPMFWKRIVSSIILIPVVILALKWSEPYLFFGLLGCVVCFMLLEFCRLFRSIASVGIRVATLTSGMLLFSSALIGQESLGLVLTLTLFIAFVSQMGNREVDTVFFSVVGILTGAVYIGWLFGYHLIVLCTLSDPQGKSVGRELVCFLLVVVWCGDATAYILGRRFGRHKLLPRISSGKTIEGSLSGLCIGTVCGLCVWSVLLKDTLGLNHALSLGLLLGVVGQFSDLSESLIKRCASVKDSGTLIPGHGGCLDRCDSLIFAAPTIYYYLRHFVWS